PRLGGGVRDRLVDHHRAHRHSRGARRLAFLALRRRWSPTGHVLPAGRTRSVRRDPGPGLGPDHEPPFEPSTPLCCPADRPEGVATDPPDCTAPRMPSRSRSAPSTTTCSPTARPSETATSSPSATPTVTGRAATVWSGLTT